MFNCPDCEYSSKDLSEFEEHYYFNHGVGTYHGKVTVKSEGKKLFSINEQLEREDYCLICEEVVTIKPESLCVQCYENECKSRGWTP